MEKEYEAKIALQTSPVMLLMLHRLRAGRWIMINVLRLIAGEATGLSRKHALNDYLKNGAWKLVETSLLGDGNGIGVDR